MILPAPQAGRDGAGRTGSRVTRESCRNPASQATRYCGAAPIFLRVLWADFEPQPARALRPGSPCPRRGCAGASGNRFRGPERGKYPQAFRSPAENQDARRPVSRVLSAGPYPAGWTVSGGWPFLWDARCRTPHATHPGGCAEARFGRFPGRATPIRSCSRWGLPCHPRRRGRGALLPHPFTLAHAVPPGGGDHGRFAFCGTFPGVAPAGRYPAPCFRGARTFLPPAGFPVAGGRPSGRLAWRDS